MQRLATQGGIAPAAGQCNAATVGDVVEVPYTAEYSFWKNSEPDRGSVREVRRPSSSSRPSALYSVP